VTKAKELWMFTCDVSTPKKVSCGKAGARYCDGSSSVTPTIMDPLVTVEIYLMRAMVPSEE